MDYLSVKAIKIDRVSGEQAKVKMDKRLLNLISDYQDSVLTALELMQRSGIAMPLTSNAWVNSDIPHHGKLEGGIPYFKHGLGCEVALTTGSVDFDFGRMAEIDGFDCWRLVQFLNCSQSKYGFNNGDEVAETFNEAVKLGSLKARGELFAVAGSKRCLAIKLRKKFPGDALPHRDDDPVLTLYVNCFLPADFMKSNHERLRKNLEKDGHLSHNKKMDYRIYFSTWLGYLGVTCEGFRSINMRLTLQNNRPEEFQSLCAISDEIGAFLKPHADALRKFRNNVFHLRTDMEALLVFATDDDGRLIWANQLHDSLSRFFSQYRVKCEIHYMKNDRMNESQITIKRAKRSARKVS